MWLRFAHYDTVRPIRNDENISLLIGIQPRHYLALGVNEQAQLVGYGTIDSVISEEQAKSKTLSFHEGVAEARNQLEGFISNRGGTSADRRSQLLLEMIEDSDFTNYGRTCIAPDGCTCLELIIKITDFLAIAARAEAEVVAFLFANEIIVQSVIRRNLDRQPNPVISYAVAVLQNRIKAPSRIPKNFSYKTRDRLIAAVVRSLVRNGLTLTRNDVSTPVSACDAMAIAASEAKLLGLTSYESIRKIYYADEEERRSGRDR